MLATNPPAIVQPGEVDNSDVIEVVGVRPDQVQKIDRRTYRVMQNSHSAQANSIQLLRGLPAVTISPDDEVMLLGSGSVTILVDGRQIHGDATQFLRTLHGNDIERIEIITNPSAQYSAEGTGGIINFVLRKQQSDGVTGSASAEISSLGRATMNGTVKYKKGKWTYELQANGDIGRSSRSTFHSRRFAELRAGGVQSIDMQTGKQSLDNRDVFLQPKVSYEIDSKSSISLEAFGGGGRGISTSAVEFLALTSDFPSFSERERSSDSISFVGAQLDFNRKGSNEGESLSASASFFALPVQGLDRGTLDGGQSFLIATRSGDTSTDAKIDWQHPIGKRILSLGGEWTLKGTSRRYAFASNGGVLDFGPDAVDHFSGRISTLSGYATFQLPIGSWTVMPGARIERSDRRISSPGRGAFRVSQTNLFPTIHVEHSFGKTVDVTISYSKRIDRPDLERLRPFPIVEGPLSIFEGNPALRDQSTDAYEVNLHYHRKKLDAGIILYDRLKSRLWSNSYVVNPQGFTVSTWVNSGRRIDRGAEIDVSTPVFRRVKANVSANIFDSRVPIGSLSVESTADTFQWTSNATIEWDGADRGHRPGDIAQLQVDFHSASRDFQRRYGAYLSFTASYTHNLSRSLALTATLSGFPPVQLRETLSAPLIQEFSNRELKPELKLKLVKTLGGPK